MPVIYAKLIQDIKDALQAADKAAKDSPEDSGSCNLDRVFLDVGEGCSFTRKSKKLAEAIATATGRDPSHVVYHNGWLRGYIIPGCWGQGARNTRAVKAAAEVLKDRGWSASVSYRAD